MAILNAKKHDGRSIKKFLDANGIGPVPVESPIITWGKFAYAPVMAEDEGKKRKQWRLFGTGTVFDYEYPSKRFHRLKYPLNQFCILEAQPRTERVEGFDVEDMLVKIGLAQKKREALSYKGEE